MPYQAASIMSKISGTASPSTIGQMTTKFYLPGAQYLRSLLKEEVQIAVMRHMS